MTLPRLTHLAHHDSASAVYGALLRLEEAGEVDRRFALRTLCSSRPDADDDLLHSALHACPRLGRLYLSAYESMGPDSLLPLAVGAEELSEIHLTGGAEGGSQVRRR